MLGKQSGGIFVILVLRLVCHNLWQPMNNHSCGFPKQIKWMIEEHAYIKAKWKTFSLKVPGPFLKKRHTEGFSCSSSAHISWFPSVAFWFHHPGKKAIHLDLLLSSLAGPDLSAPQPGGRCCTQEGHWFKSKWHSAWYLSRELVCFMVWSPSCSDLWFSLCMSDCLLMAKIKTPTYMQKVY